MYLIGNATTYAHILMWSKVLSMLEATDSVGKTLSLCCPRHPDTEIQVHQPEDFARLSPEGGCQLMCDQRLPAYGHRCLARCHSESMHLVFPCLQPCQRLYSSCQHGYQKATCGEECGLCMIKIDNLQLPCSHLKDRVCWLAQDVSKIKCDILVEKQVPSCGHFVMIQCSQDVASKTFSCSVPCGAYLSCGHIYLGSCGHCHPKDTIWPTGNIRNAR